MLMCKVRILYSISVHNKFLLFHCIVVFPDSTLSVAISGDTGEARTLQRAMQPEQSGKVFIDVCCLLH